jgi:hypothetical protein
MEELLVEKESRIEDMTLQAVYTDIVVRDLLKKWKAAQELVAVQNARLGEYEQREIQVRKMEKELAATEARLRQIEESLEYRMSIQFAKYPKLLHALARIRRIIGVK